jgi:hypothetical protein
VSLLFAERGNSANRDRCEHESHLPGCADSTQRVSDDTSCWTFHSRVAVYDMDSDMVCAFDFATIQVCHVSLTLKMVP